MVSIHFQGRFSYPSPRLSSQPLPLSSPNTLVLELGFGSSSSFITYTALSFPCFS